MAATDADGTTGRLILRRARSDADFAACVEIQRATWGRDFSGLVPASLLKVVEKSGGLVGGAFGGDGELVGFVFSLAGWSDGTPHHWSHMLAVRERARGHGLGRRLKLWQREEVLAAGIETVLWTFDPLVARNGYLNLVRLGAEIDEFVPDMYGSETGSPLHAGATDRFVVRWRLRSDRALRAVGIGRAVEVTARVREAPAVLPPSSRAPGEAPARSSGAPDGEPRSGTSTGWGSEAPDPSRLPETPVVRVPAPADLLELARRDPARVDAWRRLSRIVFPHYMDAGYRVEGLYREPDGDVAWYWLGRDGA